MITEVGFFLFFLLCYNITEFTEHPKTEVTNTSSRALSIQRGEINETQAVATSNRKFALHP